MDLTPLTESEMLKWLDPVRASRGISPKGTKFFKWICYCGKLCNIAEQSNAHGGTCGCGRDWNLDRVDPSALLVEPPEPRYNFVIIVDRGASWRVWKKKAIGIHGEFL